MKTTVRLSSLALAGVLATALAVPVLAQRGRERGGNMEENSWRAAPGQQDVGARERRGPGARGEGERSVRPERPERPAHRAIAPRGPEAPRGPQGPGGWDGPGGFQVPGFEAAAALMIPFWQNEGVVEKLALSESQITALSESHALAKEKLQESEGSIREAGKALREEMGRDNPDFAAASALLDRLTEATNEKGKIVLGHAVVVKNVLTSEQEEALKGHARGAREEHGPEARRLMEEAREIIQGGGSLEDVIALIEGSELPDPAKDRLIKMAEERAAKGPGRK